MPMRIKLILLLLTMLAYGLGYWISHEVNERTGLGSGYLRAQIALKSLQDRTREYLDHYGSLPDEIPFNKILEQRWISGENYISPLDDGSRQQLLFNLIIEASYDKNLHRWSSPPRFVISSSLPDGFGFYLDGEDGHSKTRGNDRDDINSWNPSSASFYYDRLVFAKRLEHHAIGAFLAIGFFTVCLTYKKFRILRNR